MRALHDAIALVLGDGGEHSHEAPTYRCFEIDVTAIEHADWGAGVTALMTSMPSHIDRVFCRD
jgi:hypothetical protein